MSSTATPQPSSPAPKKSIFQKLAAGLEWFGQEIGKGIAAVPKILKLTEDAEAAAKDALPEAIAVITDAGQLASATAKDGAVFLVSLGALTASISLAVAQRAVNVSADMAVAAAFESFCKDFNAQHVEDVITAWEKLAADTKKLDSTVLAALEKMKQDA